MRRHARSTDRANTWHHVTSQGARRYDIFVDDADRRHFLATVKRVFAESQIDLVAWCLMDNHFHLLVFCPNGGLSAAMQRVGTSYVGRFNHRHKFTGPLFRSRFSSVLITTDEQLLATARYIHRNPLDLGFKIDHYPWSDLNRWIAGRSTAAVIPALGGPGEYRRLVFADLPSDKHRIADGTRTWRHDEEALLVSLESIAAVTSRLALDGPGQRAVAVLMAVETGRFSSDRIAEFHRLSSGSAARTIASRARRRVDRDRSFAAAVVQARSSLRRSGPTSIAESA